MLCVDMATNRHTGADDSSTSVVKRQFAEHRQAALHGQYQHDHDDEKTLSHGMSIGHARGNFNRIASSFSP